MAAPDFIPLSGASPPGSKQPPAFINLQADSLPPAQEPAHSGFVDHTIDALKDAKRVLDKDPGAAIEGAEDALFKGTVDMVNLAASGVGALVKTMFEVPSVDPKLAPQDQHKQQFENTVEQFVKNKDKLMGALSGANNAPPGESEAAMTRLLGVLPDGISAAGDTVYEKTGSALAAAGSEGLLTLLSLRPGLVKDVIRPSFKSTPTTVSTAFDELAATKPEGATAIAEHVGQVDAKTAKYLKTRIQKFVDASDKELSEIGVKAAKANIKDLEGDYATIKGKALGKGQKADPGVLLTEETAVSPEKASATIRTTVREAQDAFASVEPSRLTDMSKPPEVRAIEREGAAAGRDKADPNPNVVYMNSGIPVSRAAVERAFTMGHEVLQAIPGVKIAEAKLGTLLDKYMRTFNPEGLGPEAKMAASEISKGFFQLSTKEHQVWQNSKGRRQYWIQMGKDAGMEFVHGFETGKKFANPIWEKARQAYKNWGDAIYAQDMRTGFQYDARDHYMPHLFKDEDAVRAWLSKKYGNKWADPRFIKDRSFDLYKEAMEAGFTPKFHNPEEIMMARQRASDITAMRTDLLSSLERDGIAVRAAKGETRPPPGYSPNSRRAPTGQRYWVHEVADAVMKNAFDSRSLWENPNMAGDLFKGYMGLKNTIIPIKLAASAFHPLHVMHIDTAAHLTRELKLLTAGPQNPVVRASRFMAAWPKILSNLVNNPRAGSPILRVFQGKRPFESLSDAEKVGYQYMTEGGLIPTRPREEMTGSIQKWRDAVHAGSAKQLWHAPWALMQGLGHPIYGHWIPSLKIASFMKDAEVAMKLNPELASDSLRRGIMLRNIAKKVESRYGEINYNSWFMNKMAKDIGVATNLSFGWNIGLIDQYAGGALDLAGASKRIGLDLLDPESKGSQLKREIKAGNLDRPIQAAIYVTTALTIGGLMHKGFTGQAPETLADYTHPKSGEKDAYGRDIRLNTMFYTREFEGLYKHMESEGVAAGVGDFIWNKGSGLVEMMRTGLEGVDSLGREVRDPNGPLHKKIEQTLLYEFAELEPISVEAMGKAKGGNKVKDIALSVAGFTPAGKYISQSKTENQIGQEYDKYVRPKETPYDAVVKSKDFKDLQNAYSKDDPSYDRLLDAAQDKYDLKSADIRRLQKQFRHEDDFNITNYQFSRLPWQQQRGLLDRMTKEERAKYLPISNKKHLRDNYEEPQE